MDVVCIEQVSDTRLSALPDLGRQAGSPRPAWRRRSLTGIRTVPFAAVRSCG
jgi:hypothetical protein